MEEILWHFLIVDDQRADEIEEFIKDHRVLKFPDRIIVTKFKKFPEAIKNFDKTRLDVIILDLKDDGIDLEDDEIPLQGEKVFEIIRQTRFVPVIFFTALPHRVESEKNPYVKVVKRDADARALYRAIEEIFQTGLPRLLRHIDEAQRSFMWDQVQTNWQHYTFAGDNTELSYMLARRLANMLERNSIRRFLRDQGVIGPGEDDPTIHPVEMYVFPPTSIKLMGGDILKCQFSEKDGYWFVLTPSCDIEHNKVSNVILAECGKLSEQPEYRAVLEKIQSGEEPSNKVSEGLLKLIGNNRKGKLGEVAIQPKRFVFLPQAFSIPDLVVDFQSLIHVPISDINLDHRVLSLDSPFAETYLAKFSEYYGRLGMPDIDKICVYNRILNTLQNERDRVIE